MTDLDSLAAGIICLQPAVMSEVTVYMQELK